MENEISNEYIENAIVELEQYFGVKEPVNDEPIYLLIRNNEIKGAMKLIANQLGLPIGINITNIPNDYTAQNSNTQFHSTHLAKVHQYGSGSEGITAQVTIPPSLPFFGSSALKNYPINVKISENSTDSPVTFSLIMAHELSHVLLYSMKHPKKENEFYTDLTAILLGFINIFKNGRKIVKTEVDDDYSTTTTRTKTTTFGYLDDDQFEFAYEKVNTILDDKRSVKESLLKESKNFGKIFLKYQKGFNRFRKYVVYLTKHTNKKISEKDGQKMTEFFQLGYMEKFDKVLIQYENHQSEIENFLTGLSHYSKIRMEKISNHLSELENASKILYNNLAHLKKQIRMMRKYVSIWYRLKITLFL